MLSSSIFALALAGLGLAQAPDGYRTVYITSNVDKKFVVQPKSATAGSTLVVQTLANKPEQQWYLKEGNSSIQLAGTQLCLQTCNAAADAQKWNVMADGRIALVASSPQECLDLQYMRATPNNPVGLYSCAGLGNAGAGDKGINWPLTNVTAAL